MVDGVALTGFVIGAIFTGLGVAPGAQAEVLSFYRISASASFKFNIYHSFLPAVVYPNIVLDVADTYITFMHNLDAVVVEIMASNHVVVL